MSNIDEIIQSDLPDIEKLMQAFTAVTNEFIEYAEQEIELRRVMQDQDAVVKEQIKMGMLKTSQGMMEHCYRQITGRRD